MRLIAQSFLLNLAVVTLPSCLSTIAQSDVSAAAPPYQATAQKDAEHTAHILHLDPRLKNLEALRAQRGCDAPATPEEITLREELVEAVQIAALDVDGVTGVIQNEQGLLSNLRTIMQASRDRTVARLNTGALIAGSGAGAVASSMQFTNLGSRTNNIGDGLGVGAGAASTLLSFLATRKQLGPSSTVGEVPNMLAPLFDAAPVRNTYYPPAVMQYLMGDPEHDDVADQSRLEQLKAQWVKAGRLPLPGSSTRRLDTAALTSSENPSVKVTIQDLSNRIAMLVDVAGRVSLMKRDLATLMRFYLAKPANCAAP